MEQEVSVCKQRRRHALLPGRRRKVRKRVGDLGDGQSCESRRKSVLGLRVRLTGSTRTYAAIDAWVESRSWSEITRTVGTTTAGFAETGSPAQSRVLVEDLEELEISYRRELGTPWKNQWDREGVPFLLRLQIKASGRYWPELILAMRQ